MSDWYNPLTLSVLFDGAPASPGESVDFTAFDLMQPERTDTHTFACWVKTTTGATDDVIISQLTGSTGWALATGHTESGDFRFTLRSFGADLFVRTLPVSQSAPVINDGNWHLIAAVTDGNSTLDETHLHLFIDGVEVTGADRTHPATTVTTTTINAFSNLLVANQEGQSLNFPGNVCHAAGWDFAMTSSEVLELYAQGRPQDLTTMSFASPVWWCAIGDGDGLGGDEFIDLSGNGNHGTQSNLVIGDFVLDVPTRADDIGETVNVGASRNSVGTTNNRFEKIAAGTSLLRRYKMRGQDDGRAPGADFIVWISTGTPDFNGDGFSGGAPTPIGSLVSGSVVQVVELETVVIEI